MSRLTGIVMDREKRHIVVMTHDGDFQRVRISGRMPEIGEEVRLPAAKRLYPKLPLARWVAVAAAILLCLTTGPVLNMVNQPPEYAVAQVSMDINPSVQFTVSNRNKVMDVFAYNDDGEKVLESVRVKGMKIDKVISVVTEKAIELGFLGKSEDNNILICVVPLNDRPIEKKTMEKTLLASANKTLAESRMNGDVQTLTLPEDIGQTAKAKGMSPGKYAVLIEAVLDGLAVTEEDIKEKSITVAIAGAGGEPDRIINQAKLEERFDFKEKKYIEIASAIGARPGEGEPDEPLGAGNLVDNTESDQEFKLIDPIRRDGNPEEPVGSGQQENKEPPVAVVAVPEKKPAATGDTVYEQKPVDFNPVYGPDEEDVSEGYMGTDESGDTTNDNMQIIKPNF
jgi:hypothetical protein